jgi:hypothetical protein
VNKEEIAKRLSAIHAKLGSASFRDRMDTARDYYDATGSTTKYIRCIREAEAELDAETPGVTFPTWEKIAYQGEGATA